MVSTRPLISKSSSPISILLWLYRVCHLQLVLPSPSCSVDFSFLLQGLCTYPSFCFLSVLTCGQPERQVPLFGRFSCFVVDNHWSGLQAEITRLVCILKSKGILCVSFSRTDFRLCISHLFVGSNFYFLHKSQWIIFPTQSRLILYSFCSNLLCSAASNIEQVLKAATLKVAAVQPHITHHENCPS